MEQGGEFGGGFLTGFEAEQNVLHHKNVGDLIEALHVSGIETFSHFTPAVAHPGALQLTRTLQPLGAIWTQQDLFDLELGLFQLGLAIRFQHGAAFVDTD